LYYNQIELQDSKNSLSRKNRLIWVGALNTNLLYTKRVIKIKKTKMNNKVNRLLFFWIPILVVYLYVFNLVLEIDIIKKFFGTLPIWGWLMVYFIVMFFIKHYIKSFSTEEDSKTDYTANVLRVNSDIILLFIFSIISFALVMYLLGESFESALTWK
jgi:uncharacterized protein with PQ loop repeat